MNQTSTRRVGAAGVATGALVASTLLFAPAQAAPYSATSDVRESQIAASAATYTGWHKDAGAGTYKVVNDGLELTGDISVIRGFEDNNDTVGSNKNIDLAADVEKIGYTVKAGGAAVLQLPVYVDSDGAGAGTATLTTLTSGPTAGGDVKKTDKWTSSEAFGTIDANDPDTTLGDIITALDAGETEYKVKGIGVATTTSAVVSDLVFAGTRFTFKNNAPVVADRTISTKINTAVSVPLTATDVDGNALTYTIDGVVGGTVSGAGATQTFTPSNLFKGNASVKYTVSDDRGGSATATVTIRVDKRKGKVDIYRIHPTRPSVRSNVYIYAAVSNDGVKASKGSTVTFYAKSKKVGTGKVNSSGKVKFKLPNKLPAGKSTLKVVQAGSSTINPGTDTIKVRVKK